MNSLRRPAGLGDGQWSAIQEAENRLDDAQAASDAPLIVGCAKELCDAIAKVVIAERGGVSTGDDLTDLTTAAHKLLAFQPGEGVASDPDTRQVAQGLKSIVLGLGGMRNRHGTGHGRASPSGITNEHAELAFAAAQLWSRWALRRLEPYIAGDVTALVRDLEGQTFRRGAFSRRLTFANLPRLTPQDQRRLGVAVGRRAAGGTFVVAEEGVEAVQPEDVASWPAAYVEGVVAGLVFHPNGFLDANGWGVSESARLIAALPDPLPVIRNVLSRLDSSSPSHRITTDDDARRDVIDAFRGAASVIPDGESRRAWLEIPEVLARAKANE
jgi:hypothetical protein